MVEHIDEQAVISHATHLNLVRLFIDTTASVQSDSI